MTQFPAFIYIKPLSQTQLFQNPNCDFSHISFSIVCILCKARTCDFDLDFGAW